MKQIKNIYATITNHVQMDKGNKILGEMNIKLDKLDVISDRLDTLPERIAEALRR